MTDLKSTPTPEVACPFCGHLLDMAMCSPSTPEATPSPGDLSLCINCGGLTIFTEDMGMRVPTDAEMAQAMSYPEVVQAIAAIEIANGRARNS